ncbi:MAG: response regulator [Candidatus Cloacimonetes bacterium]|nr:response regulator [Candidatus Cloacimonadota bacterium]
MKSRIEHVRSILESNDTPEEKLEALASVLFSEKDEITKSDLYELAKSSLLQNRPTSSFLERMSHEIRTPLHSILGFLELLRESLIDTAKREYVNEAYKSAESLHSTIDDILFYSKIESGQITLKETDFNFALLIEDIIDEFHPLTVQNKLEIVSYIPNQLYRNFFADYEKVHKIIFNLIENCIQYTDKGHILMEFSVISESSSYTDIEARILSTGIDLDETSINHLFDSFAYFGASNGGLSSSGLSLVISKKLTEILNGNLLVISQPEQGYMFKLTFRFAKSRIIFEPLLFPNLSNVEVVIFSYSEIQQSRLLRYFRDMNTEAKAFSDEDDLLAYLKLHSDDFTNFLLVSDIISFISPNLGISQETIDFISSHKLKTIFLRPLGISFPANYPINDAQYLQQPLKLTELDEVVRKVMGINAGLRFPAEPDSDTFSDEVRILICEDNAINHKLLENFLRGTFQNVDFARNGREGIIKADKYKYDIILMDCEMPIMDGFEATRHIRNSHGINSGVPIIALTAHVTREDREKCFASGMIEFISKPFRKESVLKTIHKYLSY